MVQQELVSDLDVVDFMELFNSTVEASSMLDISQSSCSRRYRAFSERYDIGFDRIGDRYQATHNLDVLANFRQASQKLRIRQGTTRCCLGWQLGGSSFEEMNRTGSMLPIRPMNVWHQLSLLEQRLVDVAVMGLMELQSMLGHSLDRLRARRMPLSSTMLCVPIGTFELQLLAHQAHPLQGRQDLSPEDLAQYPSPALPMGMAPMLMRNLQTHGLATQPCGLVEYDEAAWEGFASDGVGLSYAAPHRLPNLNNNYQLQPLNYALDIKECLAIVGHRDVIGDSNFPSTFNTIVKVLQQEINGNGAGVQWLS